MHARDLVVSGAASNDFGSCAVSAELVVAVPCIRSRDLAAQRTSRRQNAEVFVGADGQVDSVRIGARDSSARTGAFLRVYDKHLPGHAGAVGVRAEIELSRPGSLAAVEQIRIGPREKSLKLALGMLLDDEELTTAFQTILDHSKAAWWEPEPLWERAKQSTAGMVINHAGDKGLSLTGLAA